VKRPAVPAKPNPTATGATPRKRDAGPQQRARMAELHRRAEAELRERRRPPRSGTVAPNAEADTPALLHALQVHHVELQLQNQELQAARNDLERLLEEYTDLYDFAPVGYFSLTEEGRILKANLAGAVLLGVQRSRLVGQPLGRMLATEQRPAFNAFLGRVFAGPLRQAGDFELSIPGRQTRIVNLEAQPPVDGGECRVALSDITSRKRAEQHLRHALDFSEAVMANMGEGLYTLDAQGLVTSMNPAAEKLLGWRFGELRGRAMHAVAHHLHRDGTPFPAGDCAGLRVLRRGLPLTRQEDCYIRKDGSFFDVVYSAAPLRAAGRITGLVVVFRDVSERKRAEDQLRHSEVRYRRLFEAAHDGVLLLDPGTRKITDANPFMTKLLGHSREKLVGKELFEIGLLEDESANREIFKQLERKGEVRCEDRPLKSRKGRHQEVEVVANLYQENDHAVIQCNIRDITERKQAEEMLRRNEALFSALVAQAPVGVYVVDARLRLLQVNPMAAPAFKTVRPLIGRDLSEVTHLLWPRAVADRLVRRFRRTLRTGEPHVSSEFAERRRDTGVREVYEWQIQRVTLPAGEQGVVCFFYDLTERKRMEVAQRRLEVMTASNQKLAKEMVRRRRVEQALRKSERQQRRSLGKSRQMHERLRQLSRQVLAAQEEERKRISRELHDVIAQTLTGINVRLAALKREAALDPSGLVRSIARTQELVGKSLDVVHEFARELRPAMLDELGLIPALRALLRSFTERTGVRAHLTAFAGVETLDMARRTALFRVAQESLVNVARHAQATRVDVSIEKRSDGIRMRLADDGKSFPVKRVMDSRGTKRLGLLGMRERLEMVGGTFHVESAPGKGTAIEARIPLRSRGGGADGFAKDRS